MTLRASLPAALPTLLLALLLAPRTLARQPDPRAAITQGVHAIASPGSPGAVTAWDPHATIVVTGSQNHRQIPVVIAAESGKGRVVLLSHSGYFDPASLKIADTSRLVTNAAFWAAHSKPDTKPRVGLVHTDALSQPLTDAGCSVTILSADWTSSLDSIDVLMLGGGLDEPKVAAVKDYIAGGGGFITAQCGWGWRQLSGNKPMPEFSINRAIAPSGVAFTDGFADNTCDDGFDATIAPDRFSHGGASLDAILDKPAPAKEKDKPTPKQADQPPLTPPLTPALTPAQLKQAGASAMDTLRVLPATDRKYRPRLDALLRQHAETLKPTESKPLKAEDAVDRFLLAYQIDQIDALPADRTRPHPAAIRFPGDVPASAARISRTLTIDTSIPQWHSLGLYAPPGGHITVTVPAEAAAAKLAVRIGCHTDELWDHDQWKRVPRISREFSITSATTQAANAFGGLIYIDVPDRCKLGSIEVTINGAVAAPLFVLGKNTAEDWKKLRTAPGPWAELATDRVIVTVPSERIRSLDDPAPVLEFWNKVLDADADLATIPHQRHRPERYVVDVQISAGYMHSGYPIMAHLDAGAWLPSLDELSKGNWGLYHEMGHNHQQGDWTFDGTGEVTCNLFTLYVHDTVCDHRQTDSKKWLAEHSAQIAKHIDRGAPFDKWKSEPFLALAMYIQLEQAFGWDTFKKVFAQYRALPPNERPHDDDQKRDQWMVRFSKVCGKNLGPFFQAWGVPTSKTARDQIADLPDWMPDPWPPK